MIQLPLILVFGLAFAMAGEVNLASLATDRNKDSKSRRVYTNVDLLKAKGNISTSKLPLPKAKGSAAVPSSGVPTDKNPGEDSGETGRPVPEGVPSPSAAATATAPTTEPVSPPPPVDPRARIEELQARIRELERQLSLARDDLQRKQQQLQSAGQDAQKRELALQEFEVAGNRANELESELRSARAELDSLKSAPKRSE